MKYQGNDRGLLPIFSRCGLTMLLTAVLLVDSVAAMPRGTGLQIAQQQGTQQEAMLAKAKKLFQEGRQLYQQGTKESLLQAINKWEEALPLYRAVGDRRGEATTLLGIGSVYSSLGEKQKALAYLNQALALYRAVGDRRGEATALNNIGGVYNTLGEKQKALAYLNQAIPLYRAVEDRGGEATALNNIGLIYSDLGENQKALEYYNQALPLYLAVEDRGGEANTLNNIGLVYSDLGENQKALEYYNQALPLYLAVEDRGGEARTLNNIGLVYSDLGENQKALEYYNQALPLFRAVEDRGGEATTRNNIGGVYSDLGEKQKALEYYNQALPLRRAVGDRGGEATTLVGIGKVYSDLGEKQKALESYNQALPLFRAVEDRGGEATTRNNIGGVYSDLGEKQKALEYYNQALPLRRAVGDRGGEATTLNNIGFVYNSLGEKQKALEYYNQALPIARAVSDKRGEARTLNNIGLVYSDLGEKQKALESYNQALPLFRAVEDRGGEATTLNNIGTVYSSLGENEKALEEYYNQALPIYRAVEDRDGEATTLTNIGMVHSDLGENEKALESYNQALPLRRAVGDRGGEAATLNNIGAVYSSLGENQKALEYYNQALPLYRAVGDRGGEAGTLNNIGEVYNDLGEKQKALEYLNQALPLYRAVEDRDGEALTLYNTALIQGSQKNLQAALTNIQTAINIIEELRTKIASTELRTSYFATKQDYYKFYIDLLMQLHKQNPNKGYDAQALHISERSRARGLVELLTEANINIRKDINPQLLAEETRLLSLRDGKEKLLSELMSKPKPPEEIIQTTNQEIQNIIQQQKELKNKLRATNKEYADLKYPEPLTLPQIQQQLDPDTVLLQYSLGAENSYLWLVTHNSFTTYQLPKEADINKVAEALIIKLKAPSNYGASAQEIAHHIAGKTQLANKLSQIILQPVSDKLGKKRLVIVADGILHQIPFAALSDLTPQPPSLQGNGEKDQLPSPSRRGVGGEVTYQPLLVNHEIINLPSVTSLATHREKLKNRKTAPKKLAVLADPVFSNDDSRVTGKTEDVSSTDLDLERSALRRSSVNRGSLSRLPGTRQEAEAVLKLVPNTESIKAFDFDANYEWVTQQKLNQYQMVLFATHGLIDMKNPELSGIVLSLFDKQGKAKNGFLRLDDIFNLDLPAELVVLSACETGLAGEVKGEGLIGLTRGFMYAGAAKVVVSLWKVNDDATAELMTEFSGQVLKEGKSPIVALRNAQLKLWQQQKTQDPRFWAAFTIQGEWQK
ncbi:tetratricopeptide repeat protein [Anabaena sp. PCC 7108]|uniref:tetratricopeptide repeat protein n=1 Tax=Anabaena sp. PCC 7108 TaxID=163908 RepID=UPI00034AEBC7|nr:tetratricopeptide repeat protein [Anabaena sp. PCC 7108]